MANINKNQIGYNETLAAGTANALMVQYKRANAAPLDISEVFTSISAATEYALSGSTSYAGQVIAVAGEDVKTEVFTITSAGTIIRLIDESDLSSIQESSGKIDIIKVNGEALTIDNDKAVDIDLTGYATVSDFNSLVSGDTGKTIREIANDELAKQLIPETASESLDTLQEIAAWIQEHPENAAALNEAIKELQAIAHSHTNKQILDSITSEQVSAWDSAEQNAKDYATSAITSALTEANNYADSLSVNYDVVGAAASALTDAKTYVDGKVDGKFDAKGAADTALNSAKAYADGLANNYDAKGAADTAESNAKKYTDSLASNYEVAGAAASVLTDAKTYVDGKVDGKFDAAGAAATAEQNAKDYADGLASNYEVAGAAATAEQNAKGYADSLAKNYDAAGSATQALKDAKSYVDGLAVNYDIKGAADNALSSAKAYADGLSNNYDVKGAATSALTEANTYTDNKLKDYATQSYVTDQIVSAMTGGEIELTGYAKIEDVKNLDNDVYSSAKTYTDNKITDLKSEIDWIDANTEEKHTVKHWRGTRDKYEFLRKNGALDSWTKYVVIDDIADSDGNKRIVEYYGENQIYEHTGQLLPVKSIIETVAAVEPAPYDRYLVGRDGTGYRVYECLLDDEGALKWRSIPFDYRHGVRVISRGLKNFVYVEGVLLTYDDVNCGEF